MTEQEELLKKIEQEIKEYMNTGKYPIADIHLFNHLSHIKLNGQSKNAYSETLFQYKNHLKKFQELSSAFKEYYLKLLKRADVIDNQRLEKENSFLIALYQQSCNHYAIDYLLSFDELNNDRLKCAHGILLEGTSHKSIDAYDYRHYNRTYVGTVKNGVRNIQYFPADCKEIPSLMEYFISYYNEFNPKEEYLFLQPIIAHGLLSSLQVFDDGNTRLSRLLQHIKLMQLTNEVYQMNLTSPLLYATRTYFPYRNEYRYYISQLAKDANNENWNKWILFNLYRFQDQIYVNEENLEKLLTKRY